MLDLSDTVTARLPVESDSCSTLNDLLRWRAQHQPRRRAYTFLADGEAAEIHLTYEELDRQARLIATRLWSLGVEGERVLLLYPTGLDYISAFFGCLYAGAIAVPVYPPRLNRNLLRLQAIAADAQAKVALTTATVLSRVKPLLGQTPDLERLSWIATDDLSTDDEWREPFVSSDTIALLQYTSGSTGIPKGVVLTHGNLLHNSGLLKQAFAYTADSQCVTWLPMYHDMGLIGGILQPLYGGFACTLMSPTSFLQRPVRWLQAITRYHGTISGGPNFAYDLCVRKISKEQRAQLDLSSWSVAFNGAEPIRHATLERFAAAFASCGFRREAFHPCYGLAEATLIVTGSKTSALPIQKMVQATEVTARSLTSCGGTLPEQRVVIVQPESLTTCLPNQVGEIWVQGPSVAQGYWNRAEETAHTFRARLLDTGEGPFLRTGDLGFLNEDNLFVTGRLKDLIIIRGVNHYPQDIELTVEQSHPTLRPGCGAAFSVEADGEERLVVVQELDHRQQPDHAEVLENIRQAVSESHELQVHTIVLIKAGSIPKTSSGKIRRYACRDDFLAGRLETVASWSGSAKSDSEAQRSPAASTLGAVETKTIEFWLISQLAHRLGINASRIDVNQPITRYGLDSLLAVEFMHELDTAFGIRLPVTLFFESATISELAAQALSYRQEPASAETAKLTAAQTAPVADQRLSTGQQALWFLHQLSPESSAYNLAGAARIKSELNVPALRRAFQSEANRHSSLRTTFAEVNGEAVQLVHESMELFFQHEDASRWNEDELKKRLEDEAHRPFDLKQGPLLRVHLFTHDSYDHTLLLVAHHLIMDFWSLAVLVSELSIVYAAELSGGDAKLAPLGAQYTDYLRWQADMLANDEGQRLWQYWQQQLAGELPVLNLPVSGNRALTEGYSGASYHFKLNAQLTQRLKELSRQEGVTLYMLLLAAFQLLLSRYSGQKEVLIGSPIAGRNRAELSGVIGYFVNIIVLRADLSDNPAFMEFLRRTRACVLNAFKHQDYPFPLLVKRLQPERDADRSPLFQAAFVLHKSHLLNGQGLEAFALGEPGARMTLGDLQLETVAMEQRAAQFDLTLYMAEVENHLAGSFQFATALFDPSTISRMAEHFQVLLEGIVAHPESQLSAVPLLTEFERRELLLEWNDTATDYPQDTCLHKLFEAQVERTPATVAVIYEDEQLTYAELNLRANQLAHHLGASGIGVESVVGIFMERSLEMEVGLLGILKAGAAYLPLDPTYPSKRLSFMLEDADIRVVLTHQRLLQHLPQKPVQTLCLDVDWQLIAAQSSENLSGIVDPDNIAYVIYTSGSTGTPKGVMNTHRAICNRLLWMQDAYRLTGSDRVLQKTPFSFDVSVWEFFWPLLIGARLVMALPGGHRDSEYLVKVIDKEQITTLHFVPSMLSVFLEEPQLEGCRSLRQVISSGEALSFELQERFHARLKAELHNLYGPTEAAIDVTHWTCLRKSLHQVVPIGRPISNIQVYVLDEQMQPVPADVTGELYLGGVGLARGYLNRPELTAERFVPHPFASQPGARLYRTGDLVRWRLAAEAAEAGVLEYVGRIDEQVKVRGYRIEIGEVEAALQCHPAISEAVVSAREFERHEVRLVAYLVSREQPAPGVTELRSFLEEKLPEYMIPSVFMELAELPLTANGKVDRRGLPAPTGQRLLPEQEFAVARTAVEELLCSIWAEVLGVERVGIHDNFFALGGDSILSIQVIARAREAGLQLVPKQLFQHQSVAALAALHESQNGAGASVAAVGAEAVGPIVVGPVPLTPIQHAFFSRPMLARQHWNQAVLLELEPRVSAALLARVFAQLLLRHDALRMRYRQTEGNREQIDSGREALQPELLLKVDLSGVSAAQQEQMRKRVMAQAQQSLDLEAGPLLRAVLFERGEGQRPRLLVVIHHLAVDTYSWRILLAELERGYEQLQAGVESVRWSGQSSSYRQWSEALVAYAQSAEVRDGLPYWTAVTSNAGAGRVPMETESFENRYEQRERVVEQLAEESWQGVQKVCRVWRAQVREVLVAGLARVLCRWLKAEEVVMELEGHGREEIGQWVEVSGTVGWFTTRYPVLLRVERDAAQTMRAVKEQLRGVPQGGLGYGLLKYLSEDEEVREALGGPVPEVSFNYHGQVGERRGTADTTAAGLVQHVAEVKEGLRGGCEEREHVLEVIAVVRGGVLEVEWSYSAALHKAETIRRVAQEYVAELEQMIAEVSAEVVADALSPSDFPLADLSQEELDGALNELEYEGI